MLVALVAIVGTIGFASEAHADLPLTVQTDDDNYDEGDTIVISGQIETIIGDTQVTLQLFRGGNMVEIAQIQVSTDGNYSHTIIAEGHLWQNQDLASFQDTKITTFFHFLFFIVKEI